MGAKYACVDGVCFEDRGSVGMYPLFVTGADVKAADKDGKLNHPLGVLQVKPPSSLPPEGGHACTPSELKAFLDAANAGGGAQQAIPEFCGGKAVKASPVPGK